MTENPNTDPEVDIDPGIGAEPGDDAEEMEIEFPEATDCDVDDSQTSREEGDE